jgi:hypothetical protein
MTSPSNQPQPNRELPNQLSAVSQLDIESLASWPAKDSSIGQHARQTFSSIIDSACSDIFEDGVLKCAMISQTSLDFINEANRSLKFPINPEESCLLVFKPAPSSNEICLIAVATLILVDTPTGKCPLAIAHQNPDKEYATNNEFFVSRFNSAVALRSGKDILSWSFLHNAPGEMPNEAAHRKNPNRRAWVAGTTLLISTGLIGSYYFSRDDSIDQQNVKFLTSTLELNYKDRPSVLELRSWLKQISSKHYDSLLDEAVRSDGEQKIALIKLMCDFALLECRAQRNKVADVKFDKHYFYDKFEKLIRSSNGDADVMEAIAAGINKIAFQELERR